MIKLCGKCLHNQECHAEHNGHYMYCAICFTTCHILEFNYKHKPTSLRTEMEQNVKIEYSDYISTELKRIAKLEKTSLEDLIKRYEQ